MKLSQAMADAFNDQVTMEIHAAVVYRQLAIEMSMIDMAGTARWFHAQADEEIQHANKIIGHMVDRGTHPTIQNISAPNLRAETVLEAFELTINHEKKVSESIRNLYRMAVAEGDIDSVPLLHWFITEQREEEAAVQAITSRVKLVKQDGPGLLGLDDELGSRGHTAAPA
jgi:ferritin